MEAPHFPSRLGNSRHEYFFKKLHICFTEVGLPYSPWVSFNPCPCFQFNCFLDIRLILFKEKQFKQNNYLLIFRLMHPVEARNNRGHLFNVCYTDAGNKISQDHD